MGRDRLALVPPPPPPPAPAGRLGALLRGRCPACRAGAIFSGLLRMNPVCPACGLRFSREPGYFTGAMYLSYGLAVPLLALLALAVRALFPGWRLEVVLLAALVPFVPCAPLLFRVSRVLWIHLDRAIDPGDGDAGGGREGTR